MKRSDTTVRIVSGERFTPYALARKLGALAMLESSSFHKGRERYSLLMVREAFRLEQRGREIALHSGGKRRVVRSDAKDILDVQLYFANQHAQPHQDFPFPAGGIGFLSYEFAAYCDTIRIAAKHDPLDLPEASFLFGHVFVVFDHYTDLIYLIGLNYDEHQIDLAEALADVERKITDLDFNYMQPDDRSDRAEVIDHGADRDWYTAGVREIKDEIVRGNLLQAVLSRRVEVRTALPAIEAYRRLRTANPAPYLFYLNFGDYELFGSSPEVHVKLKDDRVTIRPIAGTRRRGGDRVQDLALEKELLNDEKEKAEHLMLVDLARNDIGRVCTPGTVRVTESMAVERYSHVMHIVSQVEGTLSGGKNGADLIRATFPAGTVSGAPKIRAIETLDRIERVPRRFYAGLVGYMEPGGNVDTCITIRSAYKRGDRLVLQAGAGIVYDSDPDREYTETQEKLAALARAAGVEVDA
ncbi:MAG: anthranilate synthase component I [Spirochaetaceae bacterium]|nr:MAG: anthranilate synthase component I [Spirochaetaceae bacterium]